MFTYGWDSENSEGMCESITLSLPRTKCENVRVLFSRIRLLFGVSVDPSSDANFQDQGPPGQATVMTGSKINTESSQFTLSVIEGGHDQLNKAKVSHSCLYILIARCITKVNKQNQLWYPRALLCVYVLIDSLLLNILLSCLSLNGVYTHVLSNFPSFFFPFFKVFNLLMAQHSQCIDRNHNNQ